MLNFLIQSALLDDIVSRCGNDQQQAALFTV